MRVYADTSALLAVLDADQPQHSSCGAIWRKAIDDDLQMASTNYVALETLALVQRRLGLDAARVLCDDMLPVIDVHWVERDLHDAAVAALLTARRRRLSMVDCVSFGAMRRLGIDTVFTLDRDFAEQGFNCLPAREG